jgi:hypothetical protein
MTHPVTGGTYDAQPSQVPFLEGSGWEQEPGQGVKGDVWPVELQRFEGQSVYWMRHPNVEGDPIQAAESQKPFYQERGWQVIDTEAEQSLEGLTVDELKEQLRARDLPVSGSKAELVERLRGEPPSEQELESPAEPASKEDEV